MEPGARPDPLKTQLRLPLIGACAGGGLVMFAFLIMPAAMLEEGVKASGIPAILAAAEPPLGFTARIALGLVFGGLLAAFAWFGLNLLPEDRPIDLSKWSIGPAMSKLTALLRRKPSVDGAPRPPLFAKRELGTPFLDVKAPVAEPVLTLVPPLELEDPLPPPAPVFAGPPPVRDLPRDLDQPLAAFDPGAVPDEPLPVPAPVAPLARQQLIDPGDRFETFELTPMQRVEPPSLRAEPARVGRPAPPAPERVVAPETESSIHALLERLERGVARAAVPVAAPTAEVEAAPVEAEAESETEDPALPPAPAIRAGSLQDTLGDLRRLAMGGS